MIQKDKTEMQILKKLEELIDGVHEHLDEHLEAMADDILDSIEENFKDLRNRVAALEKGSQTGKREAPIDTITQRYKV